MDLAVVALTIVIAVMAIAAAGLTVAVIQLFRHNDHLRAEMRVLADHNGALVAAADEQARAAQEHAEETRADHVLGDAPLLVILDEPPPGIREEPWAAVRVRNVGSGPALHFVAWMLAGGNLYRSAGAEAKGFSGHLHLTPGDIFEPGPFQNMLYVGGAQGYLDPGSAVVGEDPSTNLAAYCGDQFGNRYRFNLRTGDPPEVWERGADAPPWAGAWDPRLTSAASPESQANVLGRVLHRREPIEAVNALHDALHALQDANAAV
jgi:hypothetical protein